MLHLSDVVAVTLTAGSSHSNTSLPWRWWSAICGPSPSTLAVRLAPARTGKLALFRIAGWQ
eukprot:SAG22_NODE_1003_length_6085_cov_1.461243_1_plen_61_part_00